MDFLAFYTSMCVSVAHNRTCKHSVFPRVVIPQFLKTAKMARKMLKTQGNGWKIPAEEYLVGLL
jgi:hypothetical protein